MHWVQKNNAFEGTFKLRYQFIQAINNAEILIEAIFLSNSAT